MPNKANPAHIGLLLCVCLASCTSLRPPGQTSHSETPVQVLRRVWRPVAFQRSLEGRRGEDRDQNGALAAGGRVLARHPRGRLLRLRFARGLAADTTCLKVYALDLDPVQLEHLPPGAAGFKTCGAALELPLRWVGDSLAFPSSDDPAQRALLIQLDARAAESHGLTVEYLEHVDLDFGWELLEDRLRRDLASGSLPRPGHAGLPREAEALHELWRAVPQGDPQTLPEASRPIVLGLLALRCSLRFFRERATVDPDWLESVIVPDGHESEHVFAGERQFLLRAGQPARLDVCGPGVLEINSRARYDSLDLAPYLRYALQLSSAGEARYREQLYTWPENRDGWQVDPLRAPFGRARQLLLPFLAASETLELTSSRDVWVRISVRRRIPRLALPCLADAALLERLDQARQQLQQAADDWGSSLARALLATLQGRPGEATRQLRQLAEDADLSAAVRATASLELARLALEQAAPQLVAEHARAAQRWASQADAGAWSADVLRQARLLDLAAGEHEASARASSWEELRPGPGDAVALRLALQQLRQDPWRAGPRARFLQLASRCQRALPWDRGFRAAVAELWNHASSWQEVWPDQLRDAGRQVLELRDIRTADSLRPVVFAAHPRLFAAGPPLIELPEGSSQQVLLAQAGELELLPLGQPGGVAFRLHASGDSLLWQGVSHGSPRCWAVAPGRQRLRWLGPTPGWRLLMRGALPIPADSAEIFPGYRLSTFARLPADSAGLEFRLPAASGQAYLEAVLWRADPDAGARLLLEVPGREPRCIELLPRWIQDWGSDAALVPRAARQVTPLRFRLPSGCSQLRFVLVEGAEVHVRVQLRGPLVDPLYLALHEALDQPLAERDSEPSPRALSALQQSSSALYAARGDSLRAECYLQRAQLLRRDGRDRAAEQDLQASLRLFPVDSPGWRQALLSGLPQEPRSILPAAGLARLRTCVRRGLLGAPEAQLAWANVLLSRGLDGPALRLYMRCLQDTAARPLASLGLALALARLGEPEASDGLARALAAGLSGIELRTALRQAARLELQDGNPAQAALRCRALMGWLAPEAADSFTLQNELQLLGRFAAACDRLAAGPLAQVQEDSLRARLRALDPLAKSRPVELSELVSYRSAERMQGRAGGWRAGRFFPVSSADSLIFFVDGPGPLSLDVYPDHARGDPPPALNVWLQVAIDGQPAESLLIGGNRPAEDVLFPERSGLLPGAVVRLELSLAAGRRRVVLRGLLGACHVQPRVPAALPPVGSEALQGFTGAPSARASAQRATATQVAARALLTAPGPELLKALSLLDTLPPLERLHPSSRGLRRVLSERTELRVLRQLESPSSLHRLTLPESIADEKLLPAGWRDGAFSLATGPQLVRFELAAESRLALQLLAPATTLGQQPVDLRIARDGVEVLRCELPADVMTLLELPGRFSGQQELLLELSTPGPGCLGRLWSSTPSAVPAESLEAAGGRYYPLAAKPSARRFFAASPGETLVCSLRGPTVVEVELSAAHMAGLRCEVEVLAGTTLLARYPLALQPDTLVAGSVDGRARGLQIAARLRVPISHEGAVRLRLVPDTSGFVRLTYRAVSTSPAEGPSSALPRLVAKLREWRAGPPPVVPPEPDRMDESETYTDRWLGTWTAFVEGHIEDGAGSSDRSSQDWLGAGLQWHWRVRPGQTFMRAWMRNRYLLRESAEVLDAELMFHEPLLEDDKLFLQFRARGHLQLTGADFPASGSLRLRGIKLWDLRNDLTLRSSLAVGAWESTLDRVEGRDGDRLAFEIWSDYREDHELWLTAESELEWRAWRDFWLFGQVYVTTNRSLSPADLDRWGTRAGVRSHWQGFSLELAHQGLYRFADQDRRSGGFENRLQAELEVDVWCGERFGILPWLSYRFTVEDGEHEVFFGIRLQFDGLRARPFDDWQPGLNHRAERSYRYGTGR